MVFLKIVLEGYPFKTIFMYLLKNNNNIIIKKLSILHQQEPD